MTRAAGLWLLLAVLCLQPDHAIDREALAKLLWPDRFLAQAKASLRQCLLDLRRKLEDQGIDCLTVSRREVALVPGSLKCDLFELEAGLSSDDHAAAIAALLARHWFTNMRRKLRMSVRWECQWP